MTSSWPLADPLEAHGVLPADDDEFGRLFETHRRDIVVLCYRFLGSVADAEDAAQETALKAWRARGSFRGEAGVRTWLHRIATRVCLDASARRGRRETPPRLSPAADPSVQPAPPTAEILWLEPLPDWYLADSALDPQARFSLRESISLAFTCTLQALQPRQRAVLLLRDVLAWPASEVADVLGMTRSAVNSALNRARTTVQADFQNEHPDASVVELVDAADRHLLDAYMRAWETDDVDGLVKLLREEVRLAMPPSPAWYAGRSAVLELVRRWVMPMGPFRLRLTGANMQPALLLSVLGTDGSEQPIGLHVLTIDRGRVAVIDAFMDPRIAARFAAEAR